MLPYWLLFSFFAAGAVQYTPDFQRRLQGGLLLFPMIALVTIVIGLRYEVGGDWFQYIDILGQIGRMSFSRGVWAQDPGYGLLNWLAAQAGFGIWAVNLACAILFMWGLVKFARREPNPWLVFAVAMPYLIIVVAMGYTRQGVAIGLVLAGLSVLDRGILRFTFYLVLAASFHKSAVVVLPLVALSVAQRRIVTVPVMLGSAVLLYYVFVQASVDKLMANYVVAAYASQGAGVRVAMNVPPALILLLFAKRFTRTEQERKLWRNFALAALATALLLQFTDATTALDRIALYIIPLQMLVLGRVPFVLGASRGARLVLTLAIVLYSATIQFVWLNYADNAPAWLPYGFYPTAEGSPGG